jgi:hypothetical protein
MKQVQQQTTPYEYEMFGTSEAVVDANLMNAYNINMRLMGMLSDAQEMLINGDTQKANQIINRVKYYFCEYTDTRNPVYAQKLEA